MPIIYALLIALSVYVGSSSMEGEDKVRYFVTLGVILGVCLITSIMRGGH